MKKSNIILLIIGIVVAGLIVWKLASNKKTINEKSKPATDTTKIAIPVKVDTIKQQEVEMSILKTGVVTPFKESKVLATGSELIRSINFDLGTHVAKGQVLATLDNRTNELELQKARTNADKLQGDLQTYKELLAGKATTEQKVKDLQQQYNDAVNQVEQLQKQASDAYIKAPISGVVSNKNVEAGIYTSPGTEIATIVDIEQTKVQVNVTENEVYGIKKGQSVKLSADVYPDHTFTGIVTFISPQADATHNYMIELTLHNSGNNDSLLRSGTFVNTEFSANAKQQMLLLPTTAITGSGENASVFVVQGNKAVQKGIKAGRTLNDNTQITGGLQAGEIVIVSGQINLKNGTQVRISK